MLVEVALVGLLVGRGLGDGAHGGHGGKILKQIILTSIKIHSFFDQVVEEEEASPVDMELLQVEARSMEHYQEEARSMEHLQGVAQADTKAEEEEVSEGSQAATEEEVVEEVEVDTAVEAVAEEEDMEVEVEEEEMLQSMCTDKLQRQEDLILVYSFLWLQL